MQFSFTIFGIDPSYYAPIAQRADDLGFEAIWLADHVVVPLHFESHYPFSESGRPPFPPDLPISDVWVTIGHMAAVTKRIKFSTAIYLLALRNPYITARAVATAQNLSGGRVMLGVAGGWLKEEFDILGEDFEHRGARMEEILDVLGKLWTGRPVEHQGTYYRFPPVQFGAPPAQRVPVVFGGNTKAALRRAATRGDGWHGATLEFNDVVQRRKILDDLRARAGRTELPFAHYVRLNPPITADRIRMYEDAGFEHLTLLMRGQSASLVGPTLEARLGTMEEIANTIAAAGYRMG